jgi:cell fate (sporulation/competence/biofilm development) regulator YlbF (YheA/YmcA/DUF963 family)
MDEILQKLLSSELLSEEAKAEISTQWTTSVDHYKNMVREEVTMTVRAEIAEQWADERDTLIENVETFVAKKLEEEITDLKGDIERFRDLEAEYAEKIVEEKHSMAETLALEIDQLVDKMDAFFELRLTEEFEDLREDLEVVKQNDFGRKIFEAFATTFSSSYADEDSTQSKLAAAVAKLEDAQQTIGQLEESQSKMVREAKLESILAPLNGKKKEQMAFVLASVETSRLEEAYNHFIGRVLKEDVQPVENKPTQVNESVLATGNGSVETPAPEANKYSHLRKLAGMTN